MKYNYVYLKCLFTYFFVLFSYVICAQTLNNTIYYDAVKSITIVNTDNTNPYPHINLHSTQQLNVEFDILEDDLRSLQYTLIHCTENWEKSDISKNDYIEIIGNALDIDTYRVSVNTTLNYVHYEFSFPNQEIKFKISGNYILRVTDMNLDDQILFEKRIIVYESNLPIDMEIKRASIVEFMDCYHEIDFSIYINSTELDNPFDNLHATLLQNGRWDNARTNVKPLYSKSDVLIFDHERENIFKAGNEFRLINFKSFSYQTERIEKYRYENKQWNVYLFSDQVRKYKIYRQEDDLNGRLYIATDNRQIAKTEGEYASVHFFLPYDIVELDGDIYIYGELSNWQINDQFKMNYNTDKLQYEHTLLLKQGYYDYQYVYVDRKTNIIDNTFIEGCFYQTENDYNIIVYTKDRINNYDRIIGYKLGNSNKNNGN
ncbi:MAG: DUF5103 domain-containing protein [Bacteroidales bacterium]|nr:DUF5103 domain-containing protein [Bacteroidales bacterium]